MRTIIKEIKDTKEKEKISREILYDLTEWFGVTEFIENYINDSKNMPYLAAYMENKPIGFIVLNKTSDDSSEIFVMGVKKEFHRLGVGRELIKNYENLSKELSFSYSQVKTVKSGCYKEYDITNKFYISMGYVELECFPDMWNEWNPCQIYIKYLK